MHPHLILTLSNAVIKNPQLSDLFIQAGCSQLLDLSTIKPFFKSESTDKDPSVLLKYLMMKTPAVTVAEE